MRLTKTAEAHCPGDVVYRWMPCMNRQLRALSQKNDPHRLNEGGFDGVMLDNAFMSPCHCSR
jgi:predicted TIM-barrel enzyme